MCFVVPRNKITRHSAAEIQIRPPQDVNSIKARCSKFVETGSVGDLNRTGSVGDLNRTGSVGDLNRTGSVGDLNRTGSVGDLNRSCRPSVSDQTVDAVREAFQGSPGKLTRRALKELRVTQSTVVKILYKRL